MHTSGETFMKKSSAKTLFWKGKRFDPTTAEIRKSSLKWSFMILLYSFFRKNQSKIVYTLQNSVVTSKVTYSNWWKFYIFNNYKCFVNQLKNIHHLTKRWTCLFDQLVNFGQGANMFSFKREKLITLRK